MTLTIVQPALKQADGLGGAAFQTLDRPTPRNIPLNRDYSAARIAQRLQTSLDPETVVALFADMLTEAIPFDGIRYANEELDIFWEHGRQSRHACSYKLIIEDDEIGEIALRRGRKFTVEEMESLENLIAALAYPLRNALLYQRAIRQAQHDALTGLYNRQAMDRMIAREISLAERTGAPLAMVVIDIDHFKDVNDTHGHFIGDQILRMVANQIRSTVRDADLAFRYGGEEFVAVLTGATLTCAAQVADRIRINLETHDCDIGNDLSLRVTASLGVTDLRPGDTPQSLFQRADRALYEAKHSGRNRVEIAS